MNLMAIWLILLIVTINSAQDTRPANQVKEPASTKTTSPVVTVDSVLDKYVKAVGGKEALEKITSRTAKGTLRFVKGLDLTGEIETFAKSPNKILINATLPGFGLSQEGYDGSIAWTKGSVTGLRDRKGLEFEGAKLDAEFNRELKLKQLYPKMELKSTRKVAGRDAQVIVATPTNGTSETFYFDTAIGLLVRVDRHRVGPDGEPVMWEFYYEDYREVDGIKIPYQERQVTPELIAVINYSVIKHNVQIDDTKFAKPPK